MKNINENIYIDPLTGFSNFFKFLEMDISELCKNKGTVVMLDIAKMTQINKEYGREVGDTCLKELSYAIISNSIQFENERIFRTGADEFLIILPNVLQQRGNSFIDETKKLFKQNMTKHGYDNVDLHSVALEYDTPMSKIEDFYIWILKNITNNGECEEISQHNWFERIITSFIIRTKKTLEFYDEAYSLAHTDEISGIGNHRAATLYLDSLLKDDKIKDEKFSVLFIDGDELKRYNNVSYEEGNKMIRTLAQIIATTLSEKGKVFRWLSGDEFLVIIDAKYNDISDEIAESLRYQVETQAKDWIYSITISIGKTNYPEDGKNIQDIIRRAEKSNAYAKMTGKNKIVQWKDIANNYIVNNQA